MHEDVQLIITMTTDGQIRLTGPLDNKILCYGMLEAAKEIVGKRQVAPSLVQPAAALPRV